MILGFQFEFRERNRPTADRYRHEVTGEGQIERISAWNHIGEIESPGAIGLSPYHCRAVE